MDAELDAKVEALEILCAARGLTVGLAESCTGGLMSASICRRPGASAFFVGAVVSYARAVKADVLGVSKSAMAVHGEVSQTVAKAMAVGARKQLKCDWAVGITGIAGPSGGSAEKPVGTVCFAVSGPAFEQSVVQIFPTRKITADGGRQDIQRQAALFAFDFLLSAMR